MKKFYVVKLGLSILLLAVFVCLLCLPLYGTTGIFNDPFGFESSYEKELDLRDENGIYRDAPSAPTLEERKLGEGISIIEEILSPKTARPVGFTAKLLICALVLLVFIYTTVKMCIAYIAKIADRNFDRNYVLGFVYLDKALPNDSKNKIAKMYTKSVGGAMLFDMHPKS